MSFQLRNITNSMYIQKLRSETLEIIQNVGIYLMTTFLIHNQITSRLAHFLNSFKSLMVFLLCALHDQQI
jgi:hypothetical protein